MQAGQTLDQYAVFGNPIAHSKSPQIHSLFAAQTQQPVNYAKQLVEQDQFAQAAKAFFNAGGKGLNITVPFKLDAFHFADQLTDRAQRAGAVNTLALQSDATILGDNTDGFGIVTDIIEQLKWTIADKWVLIMGAGGAVRGVLQNILEQQPAQVVIANRNVAKALQLVRSFKELGKIQACGYGDLFEQQFDLIINGTSASLSGDLPPLPPNLLSPKACCYDMMYGREPTVFLNWAEENNAQYRADGLGMLVAQAAESFEIWRGVRPSITPVIETLRKEL